MMSKIDLRRPAEGPAGPDHGGRRRDGGVRPGGAKADDDPVEAVFTKAGAKIETLDEATLGNGATSPARPPGRTLPRKNATCAELLKLAEAGRVSHAFDAASAGAVRTLPSPPYGPGRRRSTARSESLNRIFMLLGGMALVAACWC